MESDGKVREECEDQPDGSSGGYPLSSEVEPADIMHRQPTINIMMIGHVNNGKSTLSRALSGENTAKFDKERRENRTIYLGYTSFKIFWCPDCPDPDSYENCPSTAMKKFCQQCDGEMTLVRHVSIVDCPGHSEFMGTMLCGASVVDGAMLVMSASNASPAPQTEEHLTAARLLGVADNLVVAQNKVDLVSQSEACRHVTQIEKFLRGHDCSSAGRRRAPIVPVCAQRGINVDALCMAIVNHIPVPERDCDSDLMMTVIRSFDVNRSGCRQEDRRGGVAGCVISSGVLRVGDAVEIRPGWVKRDSDGQWEVYPVLCEVTSAQCGTRKLDVVYPGANVGVGLTVDARLTQRDKAVGNVIGSVRSDSFPPVFAKAKIFVAALPEFGPFSEKGEDVRVNIGAFQSPAKVKFARVEGRDGLIVSLKRPCCAPIGARVAILRKPDRGSEWRLAAGGVIFKVQALQLRYM